MPDNDDLRMNQNETLNCKLALMGVWTEACREAAAYFGVNPDGSGNFSSVTQAQAGSTAGTLAVDGISADEMTSRLAASLVEHFPDKTGIITGDPAAAKAYVKQYVVDLANHQAPRSMPRSKASMPDATAATSMRSYSPMTISTTMPT